MRARTATCPHLCPQSWAELHAWLGIKPRVAADVSVCEALHAFRLNATHLDAPMRKVLEHILLHARVVPLHAERCMGTHRRSLRQYLNDRKKYGSFNPLTVEDMYVLLSRCSLPLPYNVDVCAQFVVRRIRNRTPGHDRQLCPFVHSQNDRNGYCYVPSRALM